MKFVNTFIIFIFCDSGPRKIIISIAYRVSHVDAGFHHHHCNHVPDQGKNKYKRQKAA